MHEQLVAGGARLRDAYRRARRLPAQQAVQDRRLYDHVRAAGKPPPTPPHRRGRRLLLLLGMAVSAVAFYFARQADTARPRGQTADTDAPHPASTVTPDASQ